MCIQLHWAVLWLNTVASQIETNNRLYQTREFSWLHSWSTNVYAQQEVSQKFMRTLEKLRREKQTVMERFEERIEKEQEDTNTQAKRLIADLDSKTDLLRSIREAAQRGFRNIPGNQHADKGRYRRCCPSQIHWEQWGKFDKNCWQGSGRCLVKENRKSSAWPKKNVWNIGQASG